MPARSPVLRISHMNPAQFKSGKGKVSSFAWLGLFMDMF